MDAAQQSFQNYQRMNQPVDPGTYDKFNPKHYGILQMLLPGLGDIQKPPSQGWAAKPIASWGQQRQPGPIGKIIKEMLESLKQGGVSMMDGVAAADIHGSASGDGGGAAGGGGGDFGGGGGAGGGGGGFEHQEFSGSDPIAPMATPIINTGGNFWKGVDFD
jgi:hypothetical protein